MESVNPHLYQLDEDLAISWLANERKLNQLEIDELSQSNKLQVTIDNRLGKSNSLITIHLTTDELIVGKVMDVGSDAILFKSTLGIELIPLTSISYLKNIGKAKNLNIANRKIITPSLIQLLNRNLTIQLSAVNSVYGRLVSVWQDAIDLDCRGEEVSLRVAALIKIGISD